MTSVNHPKVAIVTGAAQNLGAAMARTLAAAGYAVAVNYRPHSVRADSAGDLVREILVAGGTAAGFPADVSDAVAVQTMVEEVARVFGPPSVLINNAAVAVTDQIPWHEVTEADFRSALDTNLLGAFLCAQAVIPFMKGQGGGAIINVSSISALVGRVNKVHYVSSKAGLIGLTRSLAREIGTDNIRVNAIVPGAIETADERAYGSKEDVDNEVLALQALPRRGTPEDIADAALFLVSDRASFITGQSLIVDGGWVMY